MEENAQDTPAFHVVILNNEGEFLTESFVTQDELVARLKQLIDTDVSVSCFHGERLAISKAPYRHLITPEQRVPLYDVPADLEEEESGYLGADPTILEGPPVINRTQDNGANEFFADTDEEIGGIFDDALPDPDD